MKNSIYTWIKAKIHQATAPTTNMERVKTSIDEDTQPTTTNITETEISNRRNFISKAIVGGAGIVAGGGAVAGTSMNSTGITFDDATRQITAMPDPVGEAGKVLKSDGTKAEWVTVATGSGSININRNVLPSDRQYDPNYDFMSSRSRPSNHDTYPHTIRKAKEAGVIYDAGYGMHDWTTFHDNPWRDGAYHTMYKIGWHKDTSSKGMGIFVPAETDVIAIRSIATRDQWFSLAMVSEGTTNNTFPCSINCEHDGRIYRNIGHGHTQGIGAFGDMNKEHHYQIGIFNIPRSASVQQYVLIAGHHSKDDPSDGWVSGLAFNKNPNLYAYAHGRDLQRALNGGDALTNHSGNWNESYLTYLPNNSIKRLKIPIAPNNPDSSSTTRMLYVIGHGRDHNQHLMFVVVNGNKYQFQNDNSDIAHDILCNAGSTHNFMIVSFGIKEGDIPTDILTQGGVIDVVFNNDLYNQEFYLTEVGTYIKGT